MVTVPADARAGAIFAALADDTRRTILATISQRPSATATELSEVVPVTRQAVAKHLGVLRDAGLIEAERVGRETRYHTRSGALRPAAAWIADSDASWTSRLERLKHQAPSAPSKDR